MSILSEDKLKLYNYWIDGIQMKEKMLHNGKNIL